MAGDGDKTPDEGAVAKSQSEKIDEVLKQMVGLATKVTSMEGAITTLQAASQQASAAALQTSSTVQSPVVPSGPQTTQFRRLDVKLTEFNAENVDRWFEETERALAAANVTDSIHKEVAVQKYVPDSIRETKRSIFNTGDYNAVKQAVIKAVEKSDEERYRAYHAVQMGDRKPTAFLADILNQVPLDAQQFQDLMVKNRFLSGLPVDLRQHLQNDTFTLAAGRHAESVESYGRRVDDLYSLGKTRNAAVGSIDNADDDEATVNAIMNRMGKEKFHQKFGGNPSKGAPGRQRRRSGSGTRVGSWTDKLCQIHKNHGEKAYSCAKTDTCPMAKVLAPKPEQKNKK